MTAKPHAVKSIFSIIMAAVFATVLAACAGAGQKTGQFVDDATITSKVKTAFATDKTVSAMQINVDTNKGNVRLSGFVDSEAEKRRAEEIARNVNGVKSVTNALTIQREPASRR
jgi:osmotically-inducible protein OsmY